MRVTTSSIGILGIIIATAGIIRATGVVIDVRVLIVIALLALSVLLALSAFVPAQRKANPHDTKGAAHIPDFRPGTSE